MTNFCKIFVVRLPTRLLITLLALALLHGQPLFAEETGRDFERWLVELKKEAVSEGIPASLVAEVLAGVKLREDVIKRDRNQPEFKLTLAGYLKRIVSEQRVAKGRRMLVEHRQLLDEIAARYKVQPRFLLAFWGIESDYGRVLGDFPVIQSLVTLAFDPRRGNYFRKELLLCLHILADGLAPLERLQGSWAGAIGGLQFMPSVYRKYAVDYNGDGSSDIWRDPADMFASGANYLTESGWRFDQTWGREVALPDNFDLGLLGHENSLTLAQWQELGVRRLYGGRDLPKRDMSAALIIPDRDSGRAFLVYNNFRIILRWNRSDFFAIAVGMLADRIGAP
jgi:membrane-bound lytic murein transglycosylase B